MSDTLSKPTNKRYFKLAMILRRFDDVIKAFERLLCCKSLEEDLGTSSDQKAFVDLLASSICK